MSEQENLYVCESCGHSSPVEADACPECGGKMSLYSDEMEPDYEKMEDEELDSAVGMEDSGSLGTESLEDLASQEQEESDEEYHNDSFDDDE